jgi:histidine ammonia-lyase
MARRNGASITVGKRPATLEDVARVARDPTVKVKVDPSAWKRVDRCRKVVDDIVERYRRAYKRLENATDKISTEHDVRRCMVYGITTGFGEFKTIPIHPDELLALQRNILLSHAVGIGDNADEDDPANYFPPEVVRAALFLRLLTFLRGHSGVRRATVGLVVEMLNEGIVPLVPTRGSVGSSGDLCPLAHLFVIVLNEGRFYRVTSGEEVRRGMRNAEIFPASKLHRFIREIPEPSYKEGLALTNGAGFSAGMLALATLNAEILADTCDVAVSMTLEAVGGLTSAMTREVHDARGMIGQSRSASNIRALLKNSALANLTSEVQDVYSIRCAPQVHGASRDAITLARTIAEEEINAATDNPLIFPGNPRGRRVISAGNFHGQPLALASDFLAIALSELANISERRVQLMLDAHHNRGLWPNLTPHPGVNSGMMLAQYAVAGVVSENKVLSHPASVDSIPTSASTEDHNAMATHAARKLRMVLSNAQAVLAAEVMVAAQALEVRWTEMSSNGDGSDRFAAARQRLARYKRLFSGKRPGESQLSQRLGAGTRAVYCRIRQGVPTLVEDEFLEPRLRAARALLADGSITDAARNALTKVDIPANPPGRRLAAF